MDMEIPMKDRMPRELSKYHMEIRKGVWVDVYDVLAAWDVRNPAIQHAIKKLLQPGRRGHKNLAQDLEEAIVSVKRAIELEKSNSEMGK